MIGSYRIAGFPCQSDASFPSHAKPTGRPTGHGAGFRVTATADAGAEGRLSLVTRNRLIPGRICDHTSVGGRDPGEGRQVDEPGHQQDVGDSKDGGGKCGQQDYEGQGEARRDPFVESQQTQAAVRVIGWQELHRSAPSLAAYTIQPCRAGSPYGAFLLLAKQRWPESLRPTFVCAPCAYQT